MTEVDCTQYAALSAKTGELMTRGGRILVATEKEWGPASSWRGDLIPCPHRPFGAIELIARGDEEVTVDEMRGIIQAKREAHEPASNPTDTDYRMAEAIHERIYGPQTP